MAITLALAGDTMLGRKVAEQIEAAGPRSVVAPEVRDVLAGADLVVLNLECCVSDRGTRWPDPDKPFFFRAPPSAIETLTWLGTTDVTLANNHALDYDVDALLDTLDRLRTAGIRVTGAGRTSVEAWQPTVVEVDGFRLAILGMTDHPEDFAATPERPGVAYVDLREGVPDALTERVRQLRSDYDAVVVTPHWGPNLTSTPLPYVRRAAQVLVDSGATIVAGHSAHVFHGSRERVLYDLGDFVDDYMVHEQLRNDLGLLWLVTLDDSGPVRLRAVPIALDFCYTRLATRAEYAWVRDRLVAACGEFTTDVTEHGGELVLSWT